MALTKITRGVIKANENYDTHNINSTGIVTAVSANFTGNVSIGGTLTYQDVTNIDSVGVITARAGVHVTSGSVGIGTDTPSETLTLNHANGASIGLEYSGTENGTINVNSAAMYARAGSGKHLILGGNATEALRLKSDGKAYFTGNLGLGGQTSPGAPIHLHNFGNDGYELKITGNAVQFNRSSNSYIDQLHDTGSILFRMGSSYDEAMRITSGGLVGVNCTPLAQLQIKTGTNQNIALSSMSSEASIEAFNDAGSANVPLRLRATALKFFASSSEKFSINSDGKLILSMTGRTTPHSSQGDGAMFIEQSYGGNLKALTIRNKDTSTSAATSINFSLNRTGSDYDFNSGEITVLKEQSWTTTDTTVDSAMAFKVAENGGLTERFRIRSDGQFDTNGVRHFYAAFQLANNQSYNWDIPVPNEGGYGNSFRCECGYNHYYTTSYGAHRSAWISSRGTSTNNMIDQDQSHSQAGYWTFSKPNSTTFRVTKTAGTYGGSGYGFIHVRFNYF